MKKIRKIVSAGICSVMAASLLAGCGGGSSSDQSSGGSDSKKEMGRYVEYELNFFTEEELSDGSTELLAIQSLSDGTLVGLTNTYTYDDDGGKCELTIRSSKDQGQTWESEPFELGESLYEGGSMNVPVSSFDKEGNLFYVVSDSQFTETEDKSITDVTSRYFLRTADGKVEELPFEIKGINKTEHYEWDNTDDYGVYDEDLGFYEEDVEEEGDEGDDGITWNEEGDDEGSYSEDEYSNGINYLLLADANTLFVSDYNGVVYMVDLGSGKVKQTMNDVQWMDSMVIAGDNLCLVSYESIITYDLSTGEKTGEYTECAEKIMSKNGSIQVCSSDDKDVLYYSCQQGIFKYDLKANTENMIVDGVYSCLSETEGSASNLLKLPEDQFLLSYTTWSAVESGKHIYRYAFDPDMPAKPDNEITVYSLNDDYNLRNAVAAFQKSNPEIYVNYEFGMSGDDGMTTADAIRALNTRIMAGEGPDVLLLDGLSPETYVKEGLLEDLSDVIEKNKDNLFINQAETYKTDKGEVSAIPMSFKVPVVLGRSDMLSDFNTIDDLAGKAEAYAAEKHKKNQYFMDTYESLMLMGTLMPTHSKGWFDEDGQLKEDALAEYLTSVKKLYTACFESLSDEKQAEIQDAVIWYTEDNSLSSQWFCNSNPCWNALNMADGSLQISMGTLDGLTGTEELYSIRKIIPDLEIRTMPGTLENVYVPSNVYGVNAKSKDVASAKTFIEYLISVNGQKIISDYSGFPVNKDFFRTAAVCPYEGEDWYKADEPYSTMMTVDANGNEVEMKMYWPDDAFYDEMEQLIASTDTPCYNDSQILDTILNDCIGSVIGDESVDEAVAKVKKDINIYLAE